MKTLPIVTAVLAAAGAAHAQSLHAADLPGGAPRAAEPVRILYLGPDRLPLGDWIEYSPSQGRGACSSQLAFDSLNNTSGDGCQLPNGTTGSSRIINDMKLAAGATGRTADKIAFPWVWNATSQCYLGVVFYGDFDDTCDGPPASDVVGGIVLDFGVLPSGNYHLSADFCSVGGGPPLPADGSGAYELFMADDYDGTEFVLTSKGRWYLGDTRGDDVGHQGPIQWEDDDLDGDFVCKDYSNDDPCLDGLGAAIVIHTTPVRCYADCNGDGEVDTLDVLCYLNLYVAGDLAADCNGDGAVNTIDFLCFLNAWNEGCP